MVYAENNVFCGVTSLSFSSSGRFLFGGYDDGKCRAWDTLKGAMIRTLSHVNRVSCLGVSRNGTALCTGCWDSYLRIWSWIKRCVNSLLCINAFSAYFDRKLQVLWLQAPWTGKPQNRTKNLLRYSKPTYSYHVSIEDCSRSWSRSRTERKCF